MSEEITQEQWEQAKARLDHYIKHYRFWLGDSQVLVGPTLDKVLTPLEARYNSGERSRELYDEMLAVE